MLDPQQQQDISPDSFFGSPDHVKRVAAIQGRASVEAEVKANRAKVDAAVQKADISPDDFFGGQSTSRQPSRVTSSKPVWGQGDTSQINRAPRSAVRPAAVAAGDEGLAQPGAIAQTDFASRVLTSPKVPRSPSFAEDATARGARVNPSTSGVNAGKGMLMAPPPGGSVTPAGVGGAPDAMRRSSAITQRELDRQMKREMRPYRNERLRQENQSGGPEATLYNAATGLAKVGAKGLGFIGRVAGNEDLQNYAINAQEHAEDIRAVKGSDTFAGNVVHGGAQLAPALVVPGGPVGFGAFEASQALGEGEPLPEAIKRGVEAGVTAHLGGEVGKALTRPLARAPEAFAARVAGNVAAPAGVRAATTGQLNVTPEDIAFATVMSVPGGRAQGARRAEALRTAPTEARAQYEANRAAEESAPLYPRVKIAPTEKGVESAISTQLGTRQPLSSPRLVPRTTVQPQAGSAARPAPTSPAPTQAAQRGDFETGMEAMSAQPAPVAKTATSPAVENQSNESTRADATAPTYTVGDHLTSPTGKTFRVEAVSGDQTHVRAINRNGKPTGRTIPLRPDDVAQFERAETKPVTVRAVSGPRTVNPETHSLTDAISILGFDSTTQEGKDLAAYVQKRPGTINNTRLSNGEKRGIDNYLIPALRDLYYDVTDTNDLLDKVRSQKPIYSQHYYEAQAERDIQSHLAAEHQAWLDDKPDSQGQSESDILFRAGKSPEFVSLLNRLHDADSTAEDEARFYENATQTHKLSDDLATQLIETATARRNEQGRDQHGVHDVAQSATQPSQSGQRPQERGAELRPAEGEGDVNGELPAAFVPGDVEAPAAASKGATNTTDQFAKVSHIFDGLKAQSRETGQSLSSLVEDRINQQPLPGFEPQALSPDDATLLRQMATRAPNRPPVSEQQSPLLDTAPTVESRQAQTTAIEDAQARGAANAPLFEGKQPSDDKIREVFGTVTPKMRYLYAELGEPFLDVYKFEANVRAARETLAADTREAMARISRGDNSLEIPKDDNGRWLIDPQSGDFTLEGEAEVVPLLLEHQGLTHERIEAITDQVAQLDAKYEAARTERRAETNEPSEVLRDYPDLVTHHSQSQTRDTNGTFTIDKPKVAAFHRQLLESGKSVDQYLAQPDLFGDELTDGERDHLRELGEPARQAIAEHGQFARFLFHASVKGKGDAFLEDADVKRALGLPHSATMNQVHNRFRAELGMETNTKVSPEALYGWAADKQLPHGAVEKIKRAEDSALEKAAAMAARRKSEGGFIRFGGTGSSKQTDLGDLFGKRDRIPIDEAAHAFQSDWEDFEPMPGKANAPRAGEAYYEQGEAKRKDKIGSLRTLDLWMKANMLMGASPYSHKVGSLLSNVGAEVASSPGGALADFVVSKSTDRNRQYLIDPRGLARAAAESVTTGAKQAAEILKKGATREQIEQFGKPTELNTRSPIVNAMVNYTFRAYKAGAHIPGMFHYERAMSMQAKAQALEEVKAGKIGSHEVSQRQAEILDGNGVPEGQIAVMEGNALLAYADGVFQSDNALNNVRRRLMDEVSPGWQFAINRVVPFMKSASNAYLKMLDYTGVGPKGAAMESYRAVARKVRSGEAFRTDADQTAFSSAWGKLPVGIALFAAGAALHRNGLMTSLIYHHDDNPQPGSVRALGKLIDVARYSPIGLIMAAGATYDELTASKGDDPLTAAVKTAGEGASNLPMFQQTNDLIKTATALSEGKTSVPGVAVAIGKAAVTRTLPTMVPGYATVRDVVKGATDDKYAAGPIGKMLHIQNEARAPRSNDESAIHSAYRAANPLPPMTPLQKTKFDAKKEIETAIQRGDPNASDIIKRNVDAGLVDDDEVFDIATAAHKSGEEKMVEDFKKTPSVERKLDVFMQLSKPTREKLREQLEDAWADNAMKLTPHERAVLGPRVGQALGAQ